MAVVELTEENFEDVVRKNDMLMIDFWAPWCAPCKMFGPIFEEASERHEDVVFAKVNTEEQQALAGSFGIRSIPTLMMAREQVIVFQEAGALQGEALNQIIEEVKKLDMEKIREEIKKGGEAQ